MEENQVLRAKARQMLKGNWGSAILLVIIYLVVTNLLNIFTNSNRDTFDAVDILVFIVSILLFPLMVGYKWSFLQFTRKKKIELETLIEPYKKIFGKSILTVFLQGLFIFLWSLPVIIIFSIVFVVSFAAVIDSALDGSGSGVAVESLFRFIGIVIVFFILLMIPVVYKSISYSQSFYLLRDKPEITAMQSITLSKNIMKGYKWKYFTLYISFIGWALLSLLTIGIGLLWLIPYVETTMAEFYNQLIHGEEDTNDGFDSKSDGLNQL